MPRDHQRRKLAAGMRLPSQELVTVHSGPVRVPDGEDLIHLQLRRLAGCPVCKLHLQSIVCRHDEILAAGVREVVVFHSTAANLLPHTGEMPFAVVPDPTKRLYAALGAQASVRALLDPRAWLPILRGVVRSLVRLVRRRHPMPPVNPGGRPVRLAGGFPRRPGREHRRLQVREARLRPVVGGRAPRPGPLAAGS